MTCKRRSRRHKRHVIVLKRHAIVLKRHAVQIVARKGIDWTKRVERLDAPALNVSKWLDFSCLLD
jgi:hypothetical protein